jgi:hypothetical protein
LWRGFVEKRSAIFAGDAQPVTVGWLVVGLDPGALRVLVAFSWFGRAAGLTRQGWAAEQGAQGAGDNQRAQHLAGRSGDAAWRFGGGGGLNQAKMEAGQLQEPAERPFLPMGFGLHRRLLSKWLETQFGTGMEFFK